MNYQAHYDRLIHRAKNRHLPETTYTESHHIIPRCIGGNDDMDNLVALTAEEHFVAHLLLIKIYPWSTGLVEAVNRINNSKKIRNKKYGWLKRRISKISSDRAKEQWKDPEFRNTVIRKNSIAAKKQHQCPEFQKFRSQVMNSQWKDPEFKKLRSDAVKEQWKDPEFKERRKKEVVKQWKDPEYRKKVARAKGAPIYKLTDPEGIEYILEYGFFNWTKERKVSQQVLRKMANDKDYQPPKRSSAYGWKCEIIETP